MLSIKHVIILPREYPTLPTKNAARGGTLPCIPPWILDGALIDHIFAIDGELEL
jgi:hypothetical protein